MDNLCKRCYHNYVCEQYNENRDLTRTKCDYKNSHFIDASDVAPVRHAEWGVNVGMNFFKERNCPVCKKRIESNFWNYCPNCGANMDLHDECKQEVER